MKLPAALLTCNAGWIPPLNGEKSTPKEKENPTMAKKIEPKEIEKAVAIGQAPAETGDALYAYADFELRLGADVIPVSEGDVFTPPMNWKRNPEQEDLLLAAKKKNGGPVGLVFTYLGEFVNPNEKNLALRERRVHNVILPLEER